MQNLSLYENSKDTSGTGVVSLTAVADLIRTGADGLDELTRRCHALVETDKGGYKEFKAESMPAVTFAGEFITRQSHCDKAKKNPIPFDKRMKRHSGLVVLDFDGVDIGGVLTDVSQKPSTVLAFVSPSGKGVKVIVAVSPVPAVNIAEHKAAWRAAVEEYEHIAVADSSGSDPTRLCYLSYDPQLIFETESRQPIQYELADLSELSEPTTKKRDYTGDADVSALEFIVADDYDTWLKVGMGCHAAGVPFDVWHDWCIKQPRHEPCTCAGTWNSFSLPSSRDGKSVSWGYIFAIARENGYKGRGMKQKKERTAGAGTENDVSLPTESDREASEPMPVDLFNELCVKFGILKASGTVSESDVSELFDALALYSPALQETVFDTVKACTGLNATAIRRELKARQQNTNELPDCAERADDGKPIVWITEPDGFPKQQGALTDEVFYSLCAENQAEPFIFDNDGWCAVLDGKNRISLVSADDFRGILADRLHWWRVVYSEKRGINHFPIPEVPTHIAKGVETHKARHVKIPQMHRVVNRPLLQDDGTFATRRGYVADLKSFILSDFDFEPMSLKRARAVLTAPFQHFPFSHNKDRACAFAYLFSLLLRERLGVHVPFFHFGAARQGTGKGLLVRTMYYIAEGREIAHAAYYRDDERLIRSVSSSLLGGAPGILFDNVSDGYLVANSFLEMVATAPVVNLRVLYQTMEREVVVNSVMAFTGNNLSFDSGLRRRVQHCLLESELERPELRDNLPNLKNLVRTERRILLSAALSIISNWVKSGCPQGNINLGSYETWSNIISEVLNVAGIGDFEPVVREMSDRDIARRVFVKTVYEQFGTEHWGVKETLPIASNGTDDAPGEGILSEFLTGDKRNYSYRLGHVLRTFAGQVFQFDDGLSLRVSRVDGVSPVKYQIKQLGGTTDPDSEIGF